MADGRLLCLALYVCTVNIESMYLDTRPAGAEGVHSTVDGDSVCAWCQQSDA